jgi:hypothetical protein
MRRNRSTVLTFIMAVLVFSAIGTASASASTTPEWFVKGAHLLGTQGVSATSTAPFKFRVPSLGIAIECGGGASLRGPTIANPGIGSAELLTLKECKATPPFKCEVPKTITSGGMSTKLKYVSGTEVFDEYSPQSGETFFSLTLENCSLEGIYKITGKFCGVEVEPNAEAVVKSQVFGSKPPAGCAMKLGVNAAYLEGTMAFSLTGSQQGAIWTGK